MNDIVVERRERVRKEYRLGVLVVGEGSKMGWWCPFREAYRGRVVGDVKANASTAVACLSDKCKGDYKRTYMSLPKSRSSVPTLD